MPEIRVTPLGAGQDVGRSCILVSIAGKNVMLDCGMHMGFSDDRRFPDFSYITRSGRLTDFLDCVIISHFHLDHCGALPYFSEMVGYDGPIYMTQPTQAICPILLEDYRKIAVDKKGEANFFTSQMIKDCMKKVVAVHLHQTVQVDDELEIKAYYAGHVLGAAMFQIKVGSESVVYTGDYNMTPDRHLGAAWIDKCRPNLLITESTYATTIRDSKRCRERDFLKKVLIPVFALGRAQELCILLETFWERMDLKAPIYFSTGLTEKANHYYKLFIPWTNQKIRKTFVQRNMFEFKHIKAFDRAFADSPGPMVCSGAAGGGREFHQAQARLQGRVCYPGDAACWPVTTDLPKVGREREEHGRKAPGFLSAVMGVRPEWACAKTTEPASPGSAVGLEGKGPPSRVQVQVIMPGYCVQGTVGHKILSGQRKLEMEGRQVLEVKMQVEYMSFSAHADAKGIMQLVGQAEPENVLLVHGEAKKMEFLKQKIEQEFRVNCYMPANGETVTLPTSPSIPVGISLGLLKREMAQGLLPDAKRPRLLHGTLIMKDSNFRLVSSEQALKELGLAEHQLRFTCRVHLHDTRKEQEMAMRVYSHLKSVLKDHCVQHLPDGSVTVESILVQAAAHSEDPGTKVLLVSWTYQDEELGSYLTSLLKKGLPQAS
ncbi:integrator complex subunit 11 isoform X2 [Oryx dammah]|uniref:integrator complex subunit 11 isoform X2 n=1 Tax=Oryx dammah TaxID=59534 RepID=UPI001A9B71E2|nr:integrator complex subunit 11 isoform X2 [Oryx dammah]